MLSMHFTYQLVGFAFLCTQKTRSFQPGRKALQLHIVRKSDEYHVYVDMGSKGAHPLVAASSNKLNDQTTISSSSTSSPSPSSSSSSSSSVGANAACSLSGHYHERRCRFYGLTHESHVQALRPDLAANFHATVSRTQSGKVVVALSEKDGNHAQTKRKEREERSLGVYEAKAGKSVLHTLMREFPALGDWPLQHFLFVGRWCVCSEYVLHVA
jgi:hypothetical protein